MNLLKAPLSKNDLRCLFSEYVEEVTKNHFYIRTKTHEIHIKNPKITWEKPYTEPDKTTITSVDTTETIIGATSPSCTELFFNGVVAIENTSDFELFDSVILDAPVIDPLELLKQQHFNHNLKYHYDDDASSSIEWDDKQNIPTINTKNPIVFTADIEAIPRPVKEIVTFVIPGTNRKLVIDIDSTRDNCLVDIFTSSLDETTEDAVVHIDNFDNKNQLLTAVYLNNDEPVDVFKKDI